mgnify:CR=1 FL=1
MRPLLIVGIGGAGGKTLRAMKQCIQQELENKGYHGGIPEAWQFLHIDLQPDGEDFPAPQLLPEEQCMLIRPGMTFSHVLDEVQSKFSDQAERQRFLGGWANDAKGDVYGPPKNRRAIGRLIGLARIQDIARAVEQSIKKMSSQASLHELMKISTFLEGENSYNFVDQQPQLIFVSSLVGGTGSAMLLDISEVIKRVSGDVWARYSISFLYTSDVFEQMNPRQKFGMDSLATITELLTGAIQPLSPEIEKYFHGQGLRDVDGGGSCGLAFNYLMGTTNVVGVQVSPEEAINNVAQILSKAAMNSVIGETILRQVPMSRRSLLFGERCLPLDFVTYASLGVAKVELPEVIDMDHAPKILQAISDVLDKSVPMINFTSGGLSQLHYGGVAIKGTSCWPASSSWIPFTMDSEIGQEVLKSLKSRYQDSGPHLQMFFDPTIENREIELVQVSTTGFVPFVVKPIVNSVTQIMNEVRKSPSNYANFTSKRARKIQESILLDKPGLLTLLCGWFVAGLFGMTKFDEDSPSNMLTILNPISMKHASFSNPLFLHRRSATISPLSSVLESLALAFIQFGESGDSAHLEPYQILKHLGDEVTKSDPLGRGFSEFDIIGELDYSKGPHYNVNVLRQWIEFGRLDSAFNFNPDNVFGSADLGSLEARKVAVSDHMTRLADGYSNFLHQYESVEWDLLPEIWEVREEIAEAIQMIQEYVSLFPIEPSVLRL